MHVKFWAASTSLLAIVPVYLLLSPPSAIAREFRLTQEPEVPEDMEPLEPEASPDEMETPDDEMETPDNMITPAPEFPPEPAESPEPMETPEPAESPTPGMILEEEGVLEEGDSVLPADGSLYDEYTFSGQEGQTVTIRVESSEFDTYLALFTPDDELLEEHDDIDETNTNSQITVTLPSTGIYRVIVNAYDDQGRGEYLLQVSEAQ
ncbi:PPC domain-containing protein [Lyngbya sp. CCY1209]|jgi:hypothetical protein|uniref:PPC domain-containing protein n=1 Tax=Lyngbya sp. CCY1209 TaxID=2886103 RepID=UPI002D201224|nr:PPC domain-containing protein [Lyngbya sp. CCY1209]MEB3882162.1 PPC domain-containing protein [Lyngbya sp. CCY1209]